MLCLRSEFHSQERRKKQNCARPEMGEFSLEFSVDALLCAAWALACAVYLLRIAHAGFARATAYGKLRPAKPSQGIIRHGLCGGG
jgi:hypothetical protein